MKLAERKVGFAVTGSHCNLSVIGGILDAVLFEKAEVFPIMSESVQQLSTRFGEPADWLGRLATKAGRAPMLTIPEVEPVGPRELFDILLVCPCTGNTLAKIANAIVDSVVSMCVKAQLRNGRPVVLAITSNDLLGLNARNLGLLLNQPNIYFVPFGQDSPHTKPNSVTADWNAVVPTLEAALDGQQIQPLLVQLGSQVGPEG